WQEPAADHGSLEEPAGAGGGGGPLVGRVVERSGAQQDSGRLMDDALPLVGEAGIRARAQGLHLLVGEPGGGPGEPVRVQLVRAVTVLGDGEDDDLAAALGEGDLEPDGRAELLEG